MLIMSMYVMDLMLWAVLTTTFYVLLMKYTTRRMVYSNFLSLLVASPNVAYTSSRMVMFAVAMILKAFYFMVKIFAIQSKMKNTRL